LRSCGGTEEEKQVNITAKYTPPAKPEDEVFVSIADTAKSVRRRLWIVILVPLLAVGAAVGVSLLQPPVYETSATVVVSPRDGANPQQNFSSTLSGLQVLTHEMEVAGLNREMVEKIVNTQGDSSASMVSEADIASNLTIAQDEDTRFLILTYTHSDPKRAQEVVNNAAKVFSREAPEASGVATEAAVKVSAYAGVPATPEAPDPLRNGFGALVMGLMLGLGLAFLLEYRQVSGLHSPERVEQLSGVPTFAVVPAFEDAQARKKKRNSAA
jgi:capsular polysaccharide biosynthesis protein